MRGSAAYLGAPAGSSFEVFGVDMLVDTDYRPWLVEINAVPSLARKVKPHSSPLPPLLVLGPIPAISCCSPGPPLQPSRCLTACLLAWLTDKHAPLLVCISLSCIQSWFLLIICSTGTLGLAE